MKRSKSYALALAALLVMVGVAVGQSKPGFDAASIKASGERHDAPGVTRPPELGVRITPDRLTAANVSVRQLVYLAYNLRPFQLAGGPDWIDTDLFAIDATTATPLPRNEILLRLQTLLESRFQLQLSKQSRPMSVYALVAAPGGLKTVAPDAKPAAVPAWQVIGILSGGRQVADYLDGGFGLDKPVIDETGAADSDRFFIRLSADPNCQSNSVADCGAQRPHGAELTRLLRDQLGMELKPTTADVPLFRIQSVSHPTPN
ncbi:MAG TPA: TIGR03435 family protein [Candidatus Acidoferrales bacterium]